MSDIPPKAPNGNGRLSWFAFYPADFASETHHLSIVQAGAFYRLLCAFARHGRLPGNEAQLVQLSGCRNVKEWRAMRDVLEPLFGPYSLAAQLVQKAQHIRAERAEAGRKGGLSKASKASDLPQAKPYYPEPDPDPDPEEGVSKKGISLSEGDSPFLRGSATEGGRGYAREGAALRLVKDEDEVLCSDGLWRKRGAL